MAVLALAAVALYGTGASWGLPHATAPDRTHAWGVDDEMPLGPLSLVYAMVKGRPNPNLGYPMLQPLLVLAAYLPYFGWLWLSRQFTFTGATYPFGLDDPVAALRTLTLISHWLSVVMGAGVVAAAYEAGRTLWGRRAGMLAALMVMTSFPMFYYARTGNVDVPVLFFTALALAVFARILVLGTTLRRALLLGVFAGCALATKETSAASLVGLPLVLLPLYWRAQPAAVGRWTWSFWKPPMAALGAALAAFALGSGLLVGPDRFFAHLAFVSGRVQDAATGEVAIVQSYPFTLQGNTQLMWRMASRLADTLTAPGLLLAALGFVLKICRQPKRSLFIVSALSYLLVLFATARIVQLRYLMPVAWTLALFAARALSMGLDSSRPALRGAAALLAAGIVGTGLLRGADLTHAMLFDSRYAAGQWLEAHTQPGDRIEYFGPSQKLPPLRADVKTARAAEYRGAVYKAKIGPKAIRTIRAGWQQRRPDFVVIMPDHSSSAGAEHSATCPPPIYQELLAGSIGYRLAAEFQTPRLLPWMRQPTLDYPTVNPPIRVFVPTQQTAAR